MKLHHLSIFIIATVLSFTALAGTITTHAITTEALSPINTHSIQQPDLILRTISITDFAKGYATTPAIYIHGINNTSISKSITENLKGKLNQSLNLGDAQAFINKWLKIEPKLTSVIKKEKELDELVDYFKRLKKVSSNTKTTPKGLKIVTGNSCHNNSTTSYYWPKKC